MNVKGCRFKYILGLSPPRKQSVLGYIQYESLYLNRCFVKAMLPEYFFQTRNAEDGDRGESGDEVHQRQRGQRRSEAHRQEYFKGTECIRDLGLVN